ncbi:uncharacterized protein LOC124138828 isoform X2 [Haliotis rufescens]|uniref:uncharacterized protein LOC124138828 isoform X2 n=1 Tax=Haliotis rufescens TaxID=6454 RepID=UPI00201ED7D7|nr:uncharacterized protein LOC124138828 isoform X2 [Haliotis rufescens]
MAAEGSFEFFSNVSPFSLQHEAPFAIQGKTFNCVLQYLMYRKAVLFNDKETAEDIMGTQNPDEYELLGGQIFRFHHTTWDKERMKYLDLALEAKFTQVPDFQGQLLATHPRVLAYASPEDNIWGIGLTKTNPKATARRHWKGENDLGNALTRIRDKHMQMENRLEEGREWEDEEADGNTSRDDRRQGRQGNSQRQASRESKGHSGRGESQGVEGQGSKDGKLKRTHEQTDHNLDKRRRRNMGPRNTTTSYTEMPNQDKFVLFFGNQSPFSQHHRATFTIGGTTFNCAEQYMMYQKTVIFGNKEMELKIMATSNPVQQKRYGRQIPEFKFEVWKKHFIEVVDRATEAKFSQNPHLLEHLVATHPKLLVEASPSDRLWGIGRGQKDPLAWDKETWRGKNQLGYIMTRVRDRLMEVEDTHWEEWEKWKDDKRWEEEVEKDVRRKKRNKRRWEPDQSVPYRGRHEEQTTQTRRDGDGAEEDSITFQSKSVSFKHVYGKENFEFFVGIKSPFSQNYPASFTIDGQTFTSAEHFTLYQMAVIFEDQECQEKIMSTSDPKKQERYSRKIRNFRWDVWKQKRVQVERAIIEKFSQNSDLKEQLFATSPKLLAECNYKDVFWSTGYGLGFAKRESEAWDTNKWRGWNVLGYTLTAVRDRLMDEKILIEGDGAVGETAVGGEGTQQDRETRI